MYSESDSDEQSNLMSCRIIICNLRRHCSRDVRQACLFGLTYLMSRQIRRIAGFLHMYSESDEQSNLMSCRIHMYSESDEQSNLMSCRIIICNLRRYCSRDVRQACLFGLTYLMSRQFRRIAGFLHMYSESDSDEQSNLMSCRIIICNSRRYCSRDVRQACLFGLTYLMSRQI